MSDRPNDVDVPVPEKPAGYFMLMPPREKSDEFDFQRLAAIFWRGRRTIAALSMAGAILSGIYAFYVAVPTFSSHAVISVRTMAAGGASSLSNQIGGLAAMAGVSVRADSSMRTDAIEVLQSDILVERIIREKNLLRILFRANYDSSSNSWTGPRPPTIEEGVKAFKKRYSVTEDLRSGLITVQVTWTDRQIAARWVQYLIDFANRDIRASAIKEANSSVAYLEDQAQRVQIESIKATILQLLEASLNQAMLANARTDYAFKVLDPPRVADPGDRVSPNRKLDVALGFVGGGGAAIVFLFLRKPFPRDGAMSRKSWRQWFRGVGAGIWRLVFD